MGIIAAIVAVLIIIIILLHQRETATRRKLHKAEQAIDAARVEMKEVSDGICGQETDLGKCRGDLSSCEGKTADSEAEITRLSAELAEAKEKLSVTEESLKLHQRLTFELKRAVDNAPCGFGVYQPAHFEDAERLATRIEDQRYLISRLRGQLTDRESRISALTKKLYWASGLY